MYYVLCILIIQRKFSDNFMYDLIVLTTKSKEKVMSNSRLKYKTPLYFK